MNTLKRRLSDPDFVDDTSKVWKGKGKSMQNISTKRSSTTYQEQQEKVFGNLRLKRILKENHGQDINQLSFFFNNKEVDLIKHRSQYDASNMLGTVGGAQVSIYDNEHMGDNLDLVSNFNLAKTSVDDQNYKENNLNTFCWLSLNDTAMIAAGGIDGHVHILSITKSKEVAVLKGHTKPIIDLQRHPRNDKYILSISKDGTIRLWDMEKQQCMIVYEYQCNVACFHPSGNTFITGTANGELREWNIPAYLADNKDTMMADIHHSRLLENRHGSSTIDCIRYVNGNVLSKSINGRMEYWDPTNEQGIRSFRINTGENHSLFDISSDGVYVCVGSSRSVVYIFNLETGKMVAELSHRRSTRAIRCCIFTWDCRQVLCGGEGGFIWRYDYVDDATLESWSKWKSS